MPARVSTGLAAVISISIPSPSVGASRSASGLAAGRAGRLLIPVEPDRAAAAAKRDADCQQRTRRLPVSHRPGTGHRHGRAGRFSIRPSMVCRLDPRGKDRPYAALSGSERARCVSCRRFADSIDTIWATGQIRKGAFVVRGAATPELTDNAKATVSVQYDVTASEQVARDGTIHKRTPHVLNTSADLTLVRRGSQWRAAELVVKR